MINNTLDIESCRQQLAARGRVQIADFLQEDAAERLRECLAPHDDSHAGEGRRYAYVINLSQRWKPEWGGLLQFIDTAAM
jgi:hypothetical protein